MAQQERTQEDVRRFVQRAARNRGWQLNPDHGFLNDLEAGLLATVTHYGYYLCPCRDGTGERQKDRDIICPCVYAQKDIEEYGQCFCGLFVSESFAAENRTAEQIPERRPEHLRMQ
jgi:ferredoxin-thioredoxin reductase catalytic subunit